MILVSSKSTNTIFCRLSRMGTANNRIRTTPSQSTQPDPRLSLSAPTGVVHKLVGLRPVQRNGLNVDPVLLQLGVLNPLRRVLEAQLFDDGARRLDLLLGGPLGRRQRQLADVV